MELTNPSNAWTNPKSARNYQDSIQVDKIFDGRAQLTAVPGKQKSCYLERNFRDSNQISLSPIRSIETFGQFN